MAKEEQIWTIVHAAVSGFMIVPIFLVWLLTLGLARRRSDPARISFGWLKGCHPFLLVSLSCIIAADIANVVLYSWQDDLGNYDTTAHTHDEISGVIRSERYLSFTGNLFEHLTDILFVVLLVELGNGLMLSLERQPATYRTVLRYVSYGVSVVLLSLGLAYFAQPTSAWVAYWAGLESNSSYAQLVQALKVVGKIGAAFYIPSWIVSVFQVAYASFVMYKHKAGVLTRNCAILYLSITILDFIRWTLFLVLYAKWILPALDNPWSWNLVDALGNTWIRFIELVLLLIIGMRRRNGIWTTHQPWMASSVSTMGSTMASTIGPGPSPVMAPGTIYQQQAIYPHKEYISPTAIHPAWYMPQQVTWQHHELASPAPPPAVIMAPRELDAMQYQYAPHPILGPGYLVIQQSPRLAQPQLYHPPSLQHLSPQSTLQQQQQSQQQQQQQQQQEQTQPSQHTLMHQHSYQQVQQPQHQLYPQS